MASISKNLLNSLGLKESQAAVYLAALELGQANMQELARKSGVKRTSIYNFIEELRERGLITETKKKKRRVYSAVHPGQLVEIEKTRVTELERALPELLAVYNKSEIKPRVTFYEGMDGAEQVYADMLADKQPIIAIEDLDQMKAAMRPGFYEGYPEERARRGITFKSIMKDSPLARQFASEKNKRLLRESKFLKAADFKTEFNIYGDKVALMSLKTDKPFAVLIEDKGITQTLRLLWEELWNRLGEKAG